MRQKQTTIEKFNTYLKSIGECFCELNEVEKKRQVPTVDDLIQVIYRGVDLHGVCKCKGDPNSNSNLLSDYFYPEQEKDSRIEALLTL